MIRQYKKLDSLNAKIVAGSKATVLAAAAVLLASTSVASAHSGGGGGHNWWNQSKAHGNVDYTAGFARNAKFNVSEKRHHDKCGLWNVNGTYTLDFEYQNGHYVHDAVIANQASNGNYDISGGYPVSGSPYQTAWNGTGNVSGTSVTNSVDYTVGAPGTHMDMTGTIAPNGTMSGTWTDNYGGARTGTWTTASGAATQNTECKGDGNFRYSDVNGDWYRVKDVKYVNLDGDNAWFAGQVTKASQTPWVGNWVFVKVHDGGPPATVGDLVWGSFTDETTAKAGVASMANPADGPFTVTSGNLKVH